MKAELKVFLTKGCELANPESAILIDIYNQTNGDPCNGCGYISDCELYRKLGRYSKKNSRPGRTHNLKSVATNAEIAEEKGISKRQAAKLRREGKL